MPLNEPLLPAELAQRIESLNALHKQQGFLTSTPNNRNTSDAVSSLRKEWKELGNLSFRNASYHSAIRCYTNALQLVEGDVEQSAILYCNRSAAYLKSTMRTGPYMALADAQKVIALNPNWFKGYLRLADAYYADKKYQLAEQAYSRVLRMEPNCATARSSLELLRKEIERHAWEKQRCKTMVQSSCNKKEDGDTLSQCYNVPRTPQSCFKVNNNFSSPTNSTSCAQFVTYQSLCSTHADVPTKRGISNSLLLTNNPEDNPHLCPQDALLTEGCTPIKPRTLCLADVDSSAGKAYKEQLLSSFQSKITKNPELSSAIQTRIVSEHLKGENVDYRELVKNPGNYVSTLKAINMGIMADSYKALIGERKGYH